MEKRQEFLLRIALSLILFLVVSIPGTIASAAFLDDFEDGNYDGWHETIKISGTGGGLFGVNFHNGNNMA